MTADGAAVWVLNGRLGTLYRVDAESRIVSEPIALGQRSIGPRAPGWTSAKGRCGQRSVTTLARVDPATLDGDAYPSTAAGPTALVVAYGSVWVATAAAEVAAVQPRHLRPRPCGDPDTVGRAPSGIAAGAGAIWVACRDDDVVGGSRPI